MSFTAEGHPHRRRNALRGEWVLVSPHRNRRPWQGHLERTTTESRPSHDPGCYLCPGNRRVGDVVNPPYSSTYVFQNDFSALLDRKPSDVETSSPADSLFQRRPVKGQCRVICFSPRHDLTLAEMREEEIGRVVGEWAVQEEELGRDYTWVQVFENKGASMGCSNPHPHGQIWACDQLPNEAVAEDREQRHYFENKGSKLLLDYGAEESRRGERVVVENEQWIAVVPYWAVWPFEVLLLPRREVLRLHELDPVERIALSKILKRLLVRYDNLFEVPFPYSMGWHGAPNGDGDWRHWQLHAHWYPPLLRSATVRKFMVGYELLGEAQRDITPEQAACRLREVSERHYKEFPGVVARQA